MKSKSTQLKSNQPKCNCATRDVRRRRVPAVWPHPAARFWHMAQMPQQSWTKETTWVKRVGSSPRSSLALIYPACCKIQLGRMEPYMYRLQSRDLSFCMKPWPIPSFLCRTFAWIYWSEQSNIGSSIRQMRRTAVERGKDADNAPLLLGGQGRGRARYLNFRYQ